MELTPDSVVYLETGGFVLNATLLYSWLVMLLLTLGSWAITRNLKVERPVAAWQGVLELIVDGVRSQIAEIWPRQPERFVPFVGTLFLYISGCSLLALIPGYHPPTGSLSTTAALAIAVLVAVPFYGILHKGVGSYLRNYLQPTPLMLPFNIIGELSRTIALAVRLFGNMMSGTMLLAILLLVAPLFFPVLVQLLELLVGQVQAYIFAVLAMVYIASAAQAQEKLENGNEVENG